MLSYILLAIGFILLFAGAGWLVDGVSSLARRLHVSDLVIGLTVVAFGTSTPELFVNLSASLQGNAAIAIGNIVGSNIFNILVILGISAIIYPLAVTRGTVWKEIPLTLLAVVLIVFFGTFGTGLLVHRRQLGRTWCDSPGGQIRPQPVGNWIDPGSGGYFTFRVGHLNHGGIPKKRRDCSGEHSRL